MKNSRKVANAEKIFVFYWLSNDNDSTYQYKQLIFILELKWLGTENSKGGNSSLVIGSQEKSFASVVLVKIFGAGELKS